tara:strand:- start:261 stop:1199 length:939 start_codon:yes stop_codon:yes gene_type:complete
MPNEKKGTTKTSPISVQPLTVHIGAEISNVDLSYPLSAHEITAIRGALLRWKVVFFREQHLSHQQHIQFARQFGETTPAHVVFGSDPNHPEIYPVTKKRTAFAARPDVMRVWTDWHTDVTAALNPPFASILRAVVVPPYGGDTQWTNMVAALNGLSPVMQNFLKSLRALHRFKRASSGQNATAYNDLVDSQALSTEHPFVTVHPETKEHSLFTNQEFVKEIIGLSPAESENLLHFLWEHCVRPEFTVRFRWQPGSIAFWDNRATQHLAVRDVYDTDFDREFYRVTLGGEIPVGIDGKHSVGLSGNPIQTIRH